MIASLLLLGLAGSARGDDPVEGSREDLVRAYRQLAERLAALEAKEAERERAEAARESRLAILSLGVNGFLLSTRDQGFELRLRAVLQADGRAYFGKPLRDQDTFLIRRARLYIEGGIGDFLDYRLMPDFAGSQTQLLDAWVNLRPWSFLQLRAGKMKTPFGLERLQAEENLVFLERGLTSDLAPDRDVGAVLHGELAASAFTWTIGVLNGVPDGSSGDQDTQYGKDLVARVFAEPFRALDETWLADFGIGFAATYGKEHGSLSNTGLSSFSSDSQLVFFSWLAGPSPTATAIADGDRYRLSPQLRYYVGPVGLLAEYVYSSTQVSAGARRATIANQAWEVELSFVLTLEHPTYGGLTPKRPFDPAKRHFGAFELGARVDELRVDPAAFPLFADPTTSARRAFSWTLQLNWYLTRNVRFAGMFVRTTFDGGAGMGDRLPENALFGRLQVAF